MESESLPPFQSRLAMVPWANLPPELLAVIASDLQNPIDVDRFHSVCRSWRCSISPRPSPNKISPLFPRTVSSFCLDTEFECHFTSEKKYLIAGAVYLLCPRADPSKSWIVSVQESTAGKLLLRHALTYNKIPGSSGNSIDLSEWSVTLIALSYSFRFGLDYGKLLESIQHCEFCDCLVTYAKAIFVSEAMAVYNLGPAPDMRLCSLSMNETGASQYVDLYVDEDEETVEYPDIEDFVNFNGRIYGVDGEADVFVFDSANVQLLEMNCVNKEYGYGKRLVVSDGDLYIVLKFCINYPEAECRIYKLVMDDKDAKCCSFERIENLGDRVFFINPDCSFSISARELPDSLRGNCVVIGRGAFPKCDCFVKDQELDVYDLGGNPPEFGVLSLWKAYSAFFAPPSPWIKQLRRVHSA